MSTTITNAPIATPAGPGAGAGNGAINNTVVPVDDAAKTYKDLLTAQGELDRKHREKMQKFYFAQMLFSIAAAVVSYLAYSKYLNAQSDLLKFQRSMAEREYNRYAKTFAPVEDRYMAEVAGIPAYAPRYEATTAVMRQGAIRGFDLAKEAVLKTRTRYCGGFTGHQLKEIAIARGIAEADAVSAGVRYEDAIAERRNNDRHNKFITMFGIGRNLATSAQNGIKEAIAGYTGLANQAGGSFNNAISGSSLPSADRSATASSSILRRPTVSRSGRTGPAAAAVSIRRAA